MKITKNYVLRTMLYCGLIIAGEDEEGNLEWLGKKDQWDKANRLIKLREQIYE